MGGTTEWIDCGIADLRYIPGKMITGSQIRAACAILQWSLRQLSEKSGITWASVQRMQSYDGVPNVTARRVAKVQETLEAAGIEFLPDEGVRRRKQAA